MSSEVHYQLRAGSPDWALCTKDSERMDKPLDWAHNHLTLSQLLKKDFLVVL